MNTYSMTLNISPYKKLDMDIVNNIINDKRNRWTHKNFNSMDHGDQKHLLSNLINNVVKSLNHVDVSDLCFEYTKKGNLHVHCHILSDVDVTPDAKIAMDTINKYFSSGQKYTALLIEKTTHHIRHWQIYEGKKQWLNTITRENFPNHEIMI